MGKIAICTISSHNYMAYGLTCLYSAKSNNPSCDMFYLVADKFNKEFYEDYCKDIFFIDIEQIGIDEKSLENMAFKYNIVEFNTSVKPAFFIYLFEKGYDTVVYLDPDVECYSSFDCFFERNKEKSIIVTPHKTTVVSSKLIEDKVFLNNGIYNLGFIAMNRTNNTMSFLKWWDQKLRTQCFIDYSIGLATDQIWVELASTIFEGFYVDKDLGLNVAFWNIHERRLHRSIDTWNIENKPLVFFHFSSMSANCQRDFLDRIEEISPGFLVFYSEHIDNVKKYGVDKFEKIKYSYGNYNNGEIIEIGERWLYGFSEFLQKKYLKPFDIGKGSFYIEVLNGHNLPRKGEKRTDTYFKALVRVLGVRKTVNLIAKLSSRGVHQISNLFEKD